MGDGEHAALAEECKGKGNACLSSKDYEGAIEWYTKAIKLHEGHVYYSNRSAAYLSKGLGESALKDAEKCIEINPSFAKGYSRKGAALHKLNRYDEAIEAYNKGLEVDPQNGGLKQGLEAVQAAKAGPAGGGMGSIFGANFMEKVRAHPKLSKYLEDPTFTQLLTMCQTNPNMLQVAAQDPRIQEVFSEILGIKFQMGPSPEETQQQRELEREREKKRKEEEAEAERKRLEEEERIRRENETPEEKAKREAQEKSIKAKDEGNAHYKKKEFDQAIACYEKAIELDPENMVFLLNIASVKLEQGDLEACVEQCDKALELGREVNATFANMAKAHERKGNAYMKHKMYEKAIEAFEFAQLENQTSAVANKLKKCQVAKKKAEAEAYLDPAKAAEAKERGNEKFKAGDFSGAMEAYTEAIKRDPTNAVYYGNRASAATKIMDFGRAMEDCEKALELDPKYVKIHIKKANVHFFLKEYHKCLRSYQAALDLDPQNAEAQQGLQKTRYAIQTSQGTNDRERGARAMEDPEIRNIMTDPVMQQVLQDMSNNPASAQQHLSNPEIAEKINTLIAAGVIQTK